MVSLIAKWQHVGESRPHVGTSEVPVLRYGITSQLRPLDSEKKYTFLALKVPALHTGNFSVHC